MKYCFVILSLFLVVACNKSTEDVHQSEKQSRNPIAFADSIVSLAFQQLNDLIEVPILTEEGYDKYAFASAYYSDDTLVFYVENIGNDSIFYENIYFVYDDDLIFYESKGTGIEEKSIVHQRKVYFDEGAAIKDSVDSKYPDFDMPETIKDRFRLLNEARISTNFNL